ncbi:MAG: hypothetical protein GY797_35080 [Deltaproteobacteria bacterium]|nr:hypothetical protein [Deltaproteobacteria bacterium]
MPPHPRLDNLTFPHKLLILVLVLSLFAIFLDMVPELWDRYRVVRDVQNFYRMARYQDPTLFSNDPITGFRSIEVMVFGQPIIFYPRSLGYGLLFYLPGLFIDFIWLVKWLGFALMALCVVYLFKMGRFLGDNLTGLGLSLLFAFFILAADQSISIATGLQRAFAVPLLIMFLYYMVRKQYVGAGLMIFASTLFYLPDFPLLVIAYGLSLITINRPFKVSLTITPANLGPFILGLTLSALVVGFALAVEYQIFSFSSPTTVLSATQQDTPAPQDPFHYSQGFAPLFFGPLLGRAGILDSGADTINLIVLLILGGLIYKTIGRQSLQRLPGIFWRLLAAGGIMYTLSLFVIFGLSSLALYLPSRYTRSTLFVIALCFVGLNWPDFLRKLPNWLHRNVRLLIFFVISLGLVLVGAYTLFPDRLLVIPLILLIGLILSGIFAVLGWSFLFLLVKNGVPWRGAAKFIMPLVISCITIFTSAIYIRTMGVQYTNPSNVERDVYQSVASLPKNTLLAGTPYLMEGIPLFSKRSVLFRELFPRSSDPIVEYFDVQYAETPQPILEFCRRYKVNYLVLDLTVFTQNYLAKADFFYQPWNDQIVETVTGRSDFVLPKIQPAYASGPLNVIKCDAETILAGK